MKVRISPMIVFCLMLISGVAFGGMADVSHCLANYNIGIAGVAGSSVVMLMAGATAFRRRVRVASVLLNVAIFFLGVFLIKGKRQPLPLPFEQEVSAYMAEKRATLENIYKENGLSGDEFALITAMTIGNRQYVSRSLRQTYSISGASHVFALSGMHLGIIFVLITLLFPQKLFLRFGRLRLVAVVLATLLQLIALWTYVLLVGAHPSVMRAAVMLTAYGIMRTVSRQPDSLSVFVFTLAFLLIVWPEWLFDVGFQMSFAAVFFIVVLFLPINKWMAEHLLRPWYMRPLLMLLQVSLLSTVAQMGTAPLVAHYFHRFSTYFLLTNLPISFLATIIIYFAVLLLVSANVHVVWLTSIAATLLNGAATLMNRYLGWISSFPFASIEGINISSLQTFSVYLLISCFCVIAYILCKRRFTL